VRALVAIVLILSSVSVGMAQNCVVSGTTNYGSITQNCVVAGPSKLTFQTEIAEELVRHLPADKVIQLRSVGSASDQRVADQYQQYLEGKGFKVERGIIK
jgi:hypothetical protein